MKSRSGFTIVELIIVIAVIAILAAIGGVTYSNSQQNTRNMVRITELKRMQDAVETYYAQNGSYPTTSGAWRGWCQSYGATMSYIPGIGSYYEGSSLPLDPRWKASSDNKCYLYRSNGSDYIILAYMTAEGLCGTNGDPGNNCNPDGIRAMDRPGSSQPTFAVYSDGARTW